MELSVIIPVQNEEENLSELISRLTSTLDNLCKSYEIIFVTDLNRDQTYSMLVEANSKDSRIKVIKLTNTFGHHVCLMAGLTYSKGERVVLMDGDLQDVPEDIPTLHNKMEQGFDIVYGIKKNKNEFYIKNLFSKMFYRIFNTLTDADINNNACLFRIMSRRTVDEILKFKENDPTLDFIINLINFPSIGMAINSGKRFAGKTKYSFIRKVNLAISTALAFSTKPLRIISIIGLVVSLLSISYLIFTVFQYFFLDIGIAGWPTIIILITLLGGIQLFGLGIIGEYIGRIFMQAKNRPHYVIEKLTGDFSQISKPGR